jgi:hypothetical protein
MNLARSCSIFEDTLFLRYPVLPIQRDKRGGEFGDLTLLLGALAIIRNLPRVTVKIPNIASVLKPEKLDNTTQMLVDWIEFPYDRLKEWAKRMKSKKEHSQLDVWKIRDWHERSLLVFSGMLFDVRSTVSDFLRIEQLASWTIFMDKKIRWLCNTFLIQTPFRYLYIEHFAEELRKRVQQEESAALKYDGQSHECNWLAYFTQYPIPNLPCESFDETWAIMRQGRFPGPDLDAHEEELHEISRCTCIKSKKIWRVCFRDGMQFPGIPWWVVYPDIDEEVWEVLGLAY